MTATLIVVVLVAAAAVGGSFAHPYMVRRRRACSLLPKRVPAHPLAQPDPDNPCDPVLLARLAEKYPLARRQLAVDALGPWTAQGDGPEFQALLAQVLEVTHG